MDVFVTPTTRPPALPCGRRSADDCAAGRAYLRRQTLDLALHFDLIGLHDEAERAISGLDLFDVPDAWSDARLG